MKLSSLKNSLILTLLLVLLFFTNSSAQPYNTGIGIRLGSFTNGITLKHYVGSNSAIEGILGFGRHSFLITGLYEKHQPFPNAEGLSWFYGGGLHIGFFSDGYTYYHYHFKKKKNEIHVIEDDFNDGTTYVGADFILGLEYKFNNTPIALSLDVKPFVNFVPDVYGYWEGAFTFRFTF